MNILITAGGTAEPIDDVRSITNMATGRLGSFTANAFAEYAEVDSIYYICGKTSLLPETDKAKIIDIQGTDELKTAITQVLTQNKIDACIHSMAVSDYSVLSVTTIQNITDEIKSRLSSGDKKGGIGSCAYRNGALLVGAVVAVNCVGDVCENNRIIAGVRCDDGIHFAGSESVILNEYQNGKDFFSGNTVIGCIVTNARLDKAQATKLAAQGQIGIARAIRPVHSTFDGDTIFSLCSGQVGASQDAVGILASAAVEGAIIDAVKSAKSCQEYFSYEDIAKKQSNKAR